MIFTFNVIQVKVRIPWTTNSVLTFPITIGSVPYRPPVPQYHYPSPSAPTTFDPAGGIQTQMAEAPPAYSTATSYPQMRKYSAEN